MFTLSQPTHLFVFKFYPEISHSVYPRNLSGLHLKQYGTLENKNLIN